MVAAGCYCYRTIDKRAAIIGCWVSTNWISNFKNYHKIVREMNINFKPIEITGKLILSIFFGLGYLMLVVKSLFTKDRNMQNKIFELSNNISNSLNGNNQNREVKRIDSETSSE